MFNRNKPPRIWSRTVLKYLLILVLGVGSLYLICYDLLAAEAYRDTLERAVSVDAFVTDLSPDEADTVQVSYVYNGQYYAISYESDGSLLQMGDTVTLRIDPRDPGTLPGKPAVGIWWFGLLGQILLIVAIRVSFMADRQSYVKAFGVRIESIRSDLISRSARNWHSFSLVGVGISHLIRGIFLYDVVKIALLDIIFSGVILFMGMALLFSEYIPNLVTSRIVKLRFSELTLTEKVSVSGKAGSEIRLLRYTGQEDHLERRVRLADHAAAQLGDRILAVFCRDVEEPVLVYTSQGDILE